MSKDAGRQRSRREVLSGAALGVAALAAGRLLEPAPASAANEQPFLLGTSNEATAITTITGPNPTLWVFGGMKGEIYQDVDTGGGRAGVVGESKGDVKYGVHGWGRSIEGTGHLQGGGVYGISQFGPGGNFRAQYWRTAGVVGINAVGDVSEFMPYQMTAGVYGHSHMGNIGSGVWGDSSDGGVGVVGTGAWGVYGTGEVGVVADVASTGVGLYGFVGDTSAPAPPAGRAVYARAASTSQIALETVGRIRFTNRSARVKILSGASSKKVTIAGVTTSSHVVATLNSKRTGVYVASVVCSAGYFTIYLNKAVTSSTYVAYLVIN